jgi:hypothetical protein
VITGLEADLMLKKAGKKPLTPVFLQPKGFSAAIALQALYGAKCAIKELHHDRSQELCLRQIA